MVGGKKRTRKSVKMENDVLRSAHSCVGLCIMFLYSQRLVGFRMFSFSYLHFLGLKALLGK